MELGRELKYGSDDDPNYVLWLLNARTQPEYKSYKLYSGRSEQGVREKARWLSVLGGWEIHDLSHENVQIQYPDELSRPLYAQTSVQDARSLENDKSVELPSSQITILQRQGDAITLGISNGRSILMNLFLYLLSFFPLFFFGSILIAFGHLFHETPSIPKVAVGVGFFICASFGLYDGFISKFSRFKLVISRKGVEAYREILFQKRNYQQIPLESLTRISIDGWGYKHNNVRLSPRSKRQVSFDSDKVQIMLPYPLKETDAKWLETSSYQYLRP